LGDDDGEVISKSGEERTSVGDFNGGDGLDREIEVRNNAEADAGDALTALTCGDTLSFGSIVPPNGTEDGSI
jgi:hypothetical protein